MKKHLYIVHTPLQLWVAELLAQTNNGSHHLFIHARIKGTPFDASLFESHTILDYSPNWRGASKHINAAYKTISKSMSDDAHIYFSDIRWSLNNRVFFGKETRNARFHIIDEGIGIYLNYPITTGMWLKSAIKSGLGAKGFTPYTGHLKGTNQPRIKDIYAFHPDWVETKKPVLSIPKPKLSQDPNNGSLLFLEQSYGNLAPASTGWKTFLAPIVEKLEGVTEHKYVKAHHMIEGGIGLFENHGYKPLLTPLAIEKYIAEHPFGTVTSVNSSALLNIKAFFPEIRCISIGLDEMVQRGFIDKRRYDSFVSLFDKAGVERW